MKISLACDHGGLELKQTVKEHLTELGHEVHDFGTFTKDSCDYPDFVRPAAEAVASGEGSMAAAPQPGARVYLHWDAARAAVIGGVSHGA